MTNMPIKRFADFLSRRGELGDYLELLVTARKSIVAARRLPTHWLFCAQVGKEFQRGHGAGAHVPDHSKR